ncbi:hypothetical protein ALP39_200145 [Pseudomonas marginalis pv. marginalis]|nr:hypothetical protein ALP39_200145 [Pseudomonas marginalis pv. marginalis]
MNGDQTSEVVRRAINVLFVANPTGTSIGVLIGVILDGLLGVFTPLLKTIEWISVSALKIWHFVGFGVFAVNFPVYLARKDVDPSIKQAIDFIEEQKSKKHVNDWQARQMYVRLLDQVLERVALNDDRSKQVDRVASMVAQTENDDNSESK